MRVGFTGSQVGMTWSQVQAVEGFLQQHLYEIEELHHGCCIGADTHFHIICGYYRLLDKVIKHPPINQSKRSICPGGRELPAKDYLARDWDIANACTILLATPKEMSEARRSGTWATIRYARTLRKDLRIIFPDGSMEGSIWGHLG